MKADWFFWLTCIVKCCNSIEFFTVLCSYQCMCVPSHYLVILWVPPQVQSKQSCACKQKICVWTRSTQYKSTQWLDLQMANCISLLQWLPSCSLTMQHFIHFAIFLVLATAHLTSAAVNIMFKSCLSWIAAVRQKTKSTVFVSKPPIPELHGGSNQAVTRMALKTTCKQDCFLSASSGWSMREGCQIGLRIYAVESVMS